MKIIDVLNGVYKEEIPFLLYDGNNGYKINCLKCQFFEQNEKGRWHCSSMFLDACRKEFFNWTQMEKK